MHGRYEELNPALEVLLICFWMLEHGRWTQEDIHWTLDDDEFCDAVLCAIGDSFDFVQFHYNEDREETHTYFSDPCMLEYYRLCRAYSARRGIKLKDNPYVRKAEQFVYWQLSGSYTCDYRLHTKVSHERASGIHFMQCAEFCEHMELLERLLKILRFYKEGIPELKAELAGPVPLAEGRAA